MSMHQPVRPAWICAACGQPWPCPSRQRQLLAEYADARVSLPAAKDVNGMNAATQELADLNAAHQDLADDIAKYKTKAGIAPVDAATASPEPPKPRRARKPAK